MIWKQIKEVVAEGREPVVSIPREAEIPPEKRPVGRPKKLYKGKYADWVMKTESGNPMRCQWCRTNHIPKKRSGLTCSDQCHNALLAWVTVLKDILEGRVPASEYPMIYRGRRREFKLTPFHAWMKTQPDVLCRTISRRRVVRTIDEWAKIAQKAGFTPEQFMEVVVRYHEDRRLNRQVDPRYGNRTVRRVQRAAEKVKRTG